MNEDVIVALSTLSGGALAIIRLSGSGSIDLADEIFVSQNGRQLVSAKGFTLHYGEIVHNNEVLDDVVLSLFRAPNSYTGENIIEISCHGSSYIVEQIIELCIKRGARLAEPGEFTQRAFLAGRLDLSQAEAVADIIASSSRASHKLATSQMRGGYSAKLSELRSELIRLGALLELELDFSEEDVEFANRSELSKAMELLLQEIENLINTFSLGNAIKKGVAIAIVGAPNVGKSTLLNRLLGEDRAMVSNIAGTTRDSIEETMNIDGITYRFIDTAGIHETDDDLEKMGIERTRAAVNKAQIVIHLSDNDLDSTTLPFDLQAEQKMLTVINKSDLRVENTANAIHISAKENIGIDQLIKAISTQVNAESLYAGNPIVSNARHQSALQNAHNSLQAACISLNNPNIPTDLVASDLRHTLYYIGTITGEITTDNLLHTIFSTFCIGK